MPSALAGVFKDKGSEREKRKQRLIGQMRNGFKAKAQDWLASSMNSDDFCSCLDCNDMKELASAVLLN
jgi:hypothetical protein